MAGYEQSLIDLNSLAIFAKAVETRSFSEAAKRLKMPISTVSRRAAELEDQLGVGLLERSMRNLRLSDIGADVDRNGRNETPSVTPFLSTKVQLFRTRNPASGAEGGPPASREI
jgi:Bacterial regulatory helix-turn-helix protein, lysR family